MFCKFMIISALVAVSSSYILPESDEQNFHIVPQLYSGIDDNTGVYLVQYDLPLIRPRRQTNNDNNKNVRGSVNVGVSHTPRVGTDLNAEARARVWQSGDGRSSVDGNAFYQRHYGGQIGTQRPNYGGGVTFTHRF